MIVGSAGSAGARPHLDQTLEIIREIAREDGLAFRLGVVASDMPREVVKQAIAAGRVRPMDTMPPLTNADVDAASHIVGQLGLEAFRRALELDVDVVVLGRACDTGIFASIPAMLGFPPGIAMHMAKIIECASLCCVPGGRDTILGILDDDGFELESMAPNRAATPVECRGPFASTSRPIPTRSASRPAAPICATSRIWRWTNAARASRAQASSRRRGRR